MGVDTNRPWVVARVVEIHDGASDTCPDCRVRDDGTAWRCDQGRDRAYGEDGTPEGSAIGGLMWAILFWLVVGIALVVYGSVA